MTLQAVEDALAQSLPTRVLLVDQGSGNEARQAVADYLDRRGDYRVLCWSWRPKMPSLSGVWNRALRFVWELGGEQALVCNNDVRLHRDTYRVLRTVKFYEGGWFVTAVGVRESQFDPAAEYPEKDYTALMAGGRGGPDFSCFLISKAGHEKYPFDEGFVPAFCEDLDSHRRYMLGGDGDKIFSVNLPFHHLGSGSQTIKAYSEADRATFNRQYDQCRAYYARKWGEGPNEEVFRTPFGRGEGDPESFDVSVDEFNLWGSARFRALPTTTPELQAWWQWEGAPDAARTIWPHRAADENDDQEDR